MDVCAVLYVVFAHLCKPLCKWFLNLSPVNFDYFRARSYRSQTSFDLIFIIIFYTPFIRSTRKIMQKENHNTVVY